MVAEQALGAASKWSLPVGASLQLARLTRKIVAEAQVITAERNKLVVKYGEAGENGAYSIGPQSPKWADYVKDAQALFLQEVEIDANPIQLPATLEVPAAELIALEQFLTA